MHNFFWIHDCLSKNKDIGDVLMLKIKINDITDFLDSYQLSGIPFRGTISKISSIDAADESTIVWVSSSRNDRYELLANTRSKLIICDNNIDINDIACVGKTFIIVEDPKLSFLRIVSAIFQKKPVWGKHKSSIIDPEAIIHPETYIGPYCIVGKATIGAGTILHGHCQIYDNTEIGENVVLHSHTVLGSDGFGFVRNNTNEIEKFIHIGKTVIEDDVEIYPFSNVDRGTLSETRIKKGAKIDHFSHIGHNSSIGENTIITAGVVFCGGSSVERDSWVGVNSIIKEKIKIGKNCTVGLGAIVTKDVPDNETWLGAPARKLKEFVKLQRIFKHFLREQIYDKY